MTYRAIVKIGGKTFRSYGVEFRSDAVRDAVQLLLGYDGFRAKAVAKIQHMKPDQDGTPRWETESQLRVGQLAKDAEAIAGGRQPENPQDAGPLERRIWEQMREWFTRQGSPWRVL